MNSSLNMAKNTVSKGGEYLHADLLIVVLVTHVKDIIDNLGSLFIVDESVVFKINVKLVGGQKSVPISVYFVKLFLELSLQLVLDTGKRNSFLGCVWVGESLIHWGPRLRDRVLVRGGGARRNESVCIHFSY